ncbi:uncharacterized protein LOC133212793, partial [Neopsephotus bourkii]|uniref:uncharacterized protein LOC133212793 n=1 Tax=Neopsephotus bourkii TaxID=309878 RepID=UPI002AA56F4A
AADWYLAVQLLLTVLALALASVCVRPRGAEGERPREPVVAEAARESGPGDQMVAGAEPEAARGRLPVEEVGVVEERKEEAAEQLKKAAEEPSSMAKPSPAVSENVPWQLLTEPREPEPEEDTESKIPPLGASAGSSLRHPGQVEDAGDHAAFSIKVEEEDLDSEKEKLVVRELASTGTTPASVTVQQHHLRVLKVLNGLWVPLGPSC